MLTSMQQTMSMTYNDYDSSSSLEKNTKFWDFSLAPDAKPLFGGYIFKKQFSKTSDHIKKETNSSSSSSSSSTSASSPTSNKGEFAKDFTISQDVQKALKSAHGFKMDGRTTNNRVNGTKKVEDQQSEKNASMETLLLYSSSSNQSILSKDDKSTTSSSSSFSFSLLDKLTKK